MWQIHEFWLKRRHGGIWTWTAEFRGERASDWATVAPDDDQKYDGMSFTASICIDMYRDEIYSLQAEQLRQIRNKFHPTTYKD